MKLDKITKKAFYGHLKQLTLTHKWSSYSLFHVISHHFNIFYTSSEIQMFFFWKSLTTIFVHSFLIWRAYAGSWIAWQRECHIHVLYLQVAMHDYHSINLYEDQIAWKLL